MNANGAFSTGASSIPTNTQPVNASATASVAAHTVAITTSTNNQPLTQSSSAEIQLANEILTNYQAGGDAAVLGMLDPNYLASAAQPQVPVSATPLPSMQTLALSHQASQPSAAFLSAHARVRQRIAHYQSFSAFNQPVLSLQISNLSIQNSISLLDQMLNNSNESPDDRLKFLIVKAAFEQKLVSEILEAALAFCLRENCGMIALDRDGIIAMCSSFCSGGLTQLRAFLTHPESSQPFSTMPRTASQTASSLRAALQSPRFSAPSSASASSAATIQPPAAKKNRQERLARDSASFLAAMGQAAAAPLPSQSFPTTLPRASSGPIITPSSQATSGQTQAATVSAATPSVSASGTLRLDNPLLIRNIISGYNLTPTQQSARESELRQEISRLTAEIASMPPPSSSQEQNRQTELRKYLLKLYTLQNMFAGESFAQLQDGYLAFCQQHKLTATSFIELETLKGLIDYYIVGGLPFVKAFLFYAYREICPAAMMEKAMELYFLPPPTNLNFEQLAAELKRLAQQGDFGPNPRCPSSVSLRFFINRTGLRNVRTRKR